MRTRWVTTAFWRILFCSANNSFVSWFFRETGKCIPRREFYISIEVSMYILSVWKHTFNRLWNGCWIRLLTYNRHKTLLDLLTLNEVLILIQQSLKILKDVRVASRPFPSCSFLRDSIWRNNLDINYTYLLVFYFQSYLLVYTSPF